MLNIEEDLLHLLFQCPFAQACWFTLNVFLPNSDDILHILESIKMQLNQTFFMEIVVTMCWAIWIMRIDIIFKNISQSAQRCKYVFKKEFALVILRAKAALHPSIDLWLDSFV
jgi:sulfur transfer complex TusBCD TusB component (DsrH family)